MQRRVFVSYTRTEARQAAWVQATLSRIGHECWVDQRLEGGDEWWRTILQAIQWCDLYLPLLSPRFRDSEACSKELAYALALNRPMIPVHVLGEVGKRSQIAQIAERQWVDVRQMNDEAQGALLRAATKIGPAPSLPNPLPTPPSVPISYTVQIRQVLERQRLDRESQEWVLDEVERRWNRGEEPLDLIELLDDLQRHDDFFNALDRRRQDLRQALSAARQLPLPPAPVAIPQPVAAASIPGKAKGGGSGNGVIISVIVVFILLFLIAGCVALLNAATCDPFVEVC